MPELELKFLDNKKIVTSSELVISDVCAHCNNVKLSQLDYYLCSLFDLYFKNFIQDKKAFKFKYDYNLLLRTLLKITYNSSRTKSRENNDFEKFKNYILYGNELREDIVVKLDLIMPAVHNEKKIYPKSTRCGTFDINFKQDNFILRMISLNSFYFYIIISKEENIITELAEIELRYLIKNIPGTIIHPYKKEINITNYSNLDTFNIHQHHILTNKKYYEKFLKK
ncbi:MAG: hypothetical protein ABJD69_14095 [Dokdonia sp.]